MEKAEDVNHSPRGVAFQVTIKEAEGVSPFKPLDNKEPLSENEIKKKLELAEERRMSLKSHIKEQAASEFKRVQEKAMKVQESHEIKKKKIEESMVADLESKEQNRQQHLNEKKMRLKKRLSAHAKKVEEMHSLLEDAQRKLSERIAADLQLAEGRRNKQLESLLERMKEHDQKIAESKKNVEEAQAAYADHLEEKMMEKLENGLRNRQEQINQLLERLKEHAIHVDNVRKNKKNTDEDM